MNVLTYLNNTLHKIFLSQCIPTIHNLLQYASQNNLKKKVRVKTLFLSPKTLL